MAKTKEELNALKLEVEAMNKKLSELTDEELNMVTGGNFSSDLKPGATDDLCPLHGMRACSFCQTIYNCEHYFWHATVCDLGYDSIEQKK